MSGRQNSTLHDEQGSVDIEIETKQPQKDQKSVNLTRNQFKVAQTVDYVGVKVTEVNNRSSAQDSYGINIVRCKS